MMIMTSIRLLQFRVPFINKHSLQPSVPPPNRRELPTPMQLPIQIQEYNIGVNKSKTEDYTISMKETENKIYIEKKNTCHKFIQKERNKSKKKVALKTKLRWFNAYTASIFLYNISYGH